MSKNSLLCKGIAVVVILLFIGLAFAPSINADVSKEELVEVTTEFCGLGKKHTVQLTQEQADELDQLFDDIKERLDNIETREETIEIFNEAIVELDRYGLLGGLSVEQAQRLVIGRFQNQRVMKFLEKMLERNQYIINRNYFCLIAGKSSNTMFLPIWLRILGERSPYSDQVFILVVLSNFFPAKFLSFITLGVEGIHPGGDFFWPASGWVWTLGILGFKRWDGKFIGGFEKIENIYIAIYDEDIFIGVKGFTGFNFFRNIGLQYYLGFANRVKIEEVE